MIRCLSVFCLFLPLECKLRVDLNWVYILFTVSLLDLYQSWQIVDIQQRVINEWITLFYLAFNFGTGDVWNKSLNSARRGKIQNIEFKEAARKQ